MFRSRVCSRALGWRAPWGAACTPRFMYESRAGSVARAPGVQSRETGQVTTGSLSDQLEPTSHMQTPKMSKKKNNIFYLSLLLFRTTQRLGNHGTAAAFQAFPSVTATNGAPVCGFASVRVCARVSLLGPTAVGSRKTAVSRTEVPFSFYCYFSFLLSVPSAAAVCLYHTVSF